MDMPLTDWTWDDYVSQITDRLNVGGLDRLINGLEVLQRCEDMFRASSFADMPDENRKAIAGTIGRAAMQKAFGAVNFHQFGRMSGNGAFSGLLNDLDAVRELSGALDAIPIDGTVEKKHYIKFLSHIHKAHKNIEKEPGVATATRLLAMKRPDVFVCIDKANRDLLARELNFRPGSLNLTNYWQWVIMPIQQSAWFAAPASSPENDEAYKIWRGRVALLDIAFFAPD